MVLSEINKRIQNILGIDFHLQKEHCNNDVIYTMRISNQKDCINFLNYIYKDATIYLDRKYNLYLEYLNKSLSK